MAVFFLFGFVGDVDGLDRARLVADGQAAFGVGAHFVEGGFVRAADLLAVGAGFGAGVDVRRARGDRAVGVRSHLVKGGLADAGAGRDGGLGVGGLDGLVVALDAACFAHGLLDA